MMAAPEARIAAGIHPVAATERALSRPASPRERWVEVTVACRAWAVDHPHEFARIYGSPIPGYAGPAETHTAASRMPLALVRVVRDAVKADKCHRPADHPHGDECAFCASKAEQKPHLPTHVLAPEVREIIPDMDFEIFGHLERAVPDHETYFRHIADQVAWELGLD